MPATDRILSLCQEIAAELRAIAMDEDEMLTPEERRALVEIALEVERKARLGVASTPE